MSHQPPATPEWERDRLSRAEIAKDVVQAGVGVTAATVSRVTAIVAGAVREVADAVGDGATEIFELRDAARRAREAHADAPGADDATSPPRP